MGVVIKALNQDMPYDQFVRWQTAGDQLAPDLPNPESCFMVLWFYGRNSPFF